MLPSKDMTKSDEAPIKILNVDDDERGRYVVSKHLRIAGFSVFEAHTGAEALQLASELQPDLVLLDVNLPDIDGIEVCRRLKRDMGSRSVAVIHMSATRTTSENKASGLESGADAYLVEPVPPLELVAVIRAMVRVRRAEKAAREASSEWKATFDSMHDGVCLLDHEGRIRKFNKAFEDMVGGLAEDRSWVEIVEEKLGSLQRGGTRVALEKPENSVVELRLGTRWFRISSDLFLDSQGNASGWVRTIADITELRNQAEELRRSNRDLEQFAALASHDLKEPLRTIGSYLKLLEKKLGPNIEPESKELMKVAINGATRMNSLIEGLLSYAHAGNSKMHFERIDCNAVLDTVLLNLGKIIEDTRTKIMREELPIVTGDFRQLTHLFQNLISNSIKYRGSSVPKVMVVGRSQNEMCQISFYDNGIGIPGEYHEVIFGLFRRLHSQDQYAGAGLGLAICQRIVERHGGRIWLDSEAGKGSVFHITLQRAPE